MNSDTDAIKHHMFILQDELAEIADKCSKARDAVFEKEKAFNKLLDQKIAIKRKIEHELFLLNEILYHKE